VGDPMYGPPGQAAPLSSRRFEPPPMGLRAVSLSYPDPFTKRPVRIQAPTEEFLQRFGFK
jgi:hypothetical protein